MMNKIQPQLGETVSFVRQTAEGEIVHGVGRVKGIFLSPHQHPMVQVVADAGSVHNVEMACLNLMEDGVAAFTAMCAKVKSLSEEGNKLAQATVAEYNTKVDAAYAEVLGVQLEI
jgi:hypothetical protein